MTKRLPSCVVDTADGTRMIGMLFMKNERVIVLLNNISDAAELGPFVPVRDEQVDPEADLYVIPADRVTSLTELEQL